MFRFISYIKFLFSATNQHGVHSPFVYDYVTKCLYKKKQLKLPLSSKILIKTLEYFKEESINIFGNNESFKKAVAHYCPNIVITEENTNFISGSIPDFKNYNVVLNNLEHDTILFLDAIHKDRRNLAYWEKLKSLDHVRVTVDLFYCGIIFFRKEQAKEHFKIRI